MSLDGRGGEGPAPGPRYLYYRPYQEDGAIESRSPAYSNDRFIGRILLKAVTPPHTAASVKSHLCAIEGFSGSENASLYSSLSSQTILDNSSRLALMNRSGPGSSEKEPMVLLIKNIGKRSAGGPQTPAGLPENPRANNINYIYYRHYNKKGETNSKMSFNEDDPALGHINSLSVTLPFSVSSLKARLAKVEGVGNKNSQLFEDLSADSPMSDSDGIALLTDQYPRSTADEPLAFVCLEESGAGGDDKDDDDIPDLEAPEDDVPIDETGIDPQDIDLVLLHVNCSRAKAVRALKESGGDLIEAIMAACE